jgi:hypothetical protein
MVTAHPQANILFRGTLDMSASSNWTNLFPVFAQYGIGAFCKPDLTVPASWAGFTGIIQVIQDAVDGMLYQVRSHKARQRTPLSYKVRRSEVSRRKRSLNPGGLYEWNRGHKLLYIRPKSPHWSGHAGFFRNYDSASIVLPSIGHVF